MKTKKILCIFFSFILLLIFSPGIQSQTAAHTVLIETNKGKMKCILYEQTPMHTDNFINLVNEEKYNGILFHRVIKDFMIQSGDLNSKNSPKGTALATGGPGYRIPAEFHPDLYHKKGAMAAARQGDNTNPNRESNGSQFYIVQGKVFSDEQLNQMERSGAHIKFTAEQRMFYKTLGGSPHLDYDYTVFGEVIEGLQVIDAIASESTDERDRPLEDVKIIKITVLK